MKLLDLDAIAERPTAMHDRAALIRKHFAALGAEYQAHALEVAAPLIALQNRIEGALQ